MVECDCVDLLVTTQLNHNSIKPNITKVEFDPQMSLHHNLKLNISISQLLLTFGFLDQQQEWIQQQQQQQ